MSYLLTCFILFFINFFIFSGGEDIVAKKIESKKKWDEITFKECSFKPTLISKQCSSNDFYNSKKFNFEGSEESKSKFDNNNLNLNASSFSMKYDKSNKSNFSANDYYNYNNSIALEGNKSDDQKINNNENYNNDKNNNNNDNKDNNNNDNDNDSADNSNKISINDNNNNNDNNYKNKNIDDFDLDYQDFQNGKTSKIKIKRINLEKNKFISKNDFHPTSSSLSKINKKSKLDQNFNSVEEKKKLKTREINKFDCEKLKIKKGYYE